jgi:hypothetical protein
MLLVFGEMRKTYPVYYKQLTRQEAENMVSVWADLFVDYPASLILAAAKQFMMNDTKGFPPVPGQIMAIVNATLKPASDVPSEAEAWEQIKRAVSNGLYNAGREFDKLHPILKRLVGGPDTLYRWALMEEETLDMNIRPMICRSYNQYAEQERADKLLPPSMQANVKALRDAARPALEEPHEEPLRIESREPERPQNGGAGFERFMAALKGLAGTKSMDGELSDDTRMDDMEARAKLERMAQTLRGGAV